MKLTYETVEFEKIPKKRNIHDQYYVIEKKFGISEGLIIWNDTHKKYGYMPARVDWISPGLLSEISEFLKQLNDELSDETSALRIADVKPSFLLDQDSCEYNHELLIERGWDQEHNKNSVYSWEEYFKRWDIQDIDGDRYTVKVSLRKNENYCHTYINGKWVGRTLTFADADNVVNSIKASCK